jgi:hypothetical protein
MSLSITSVTLDQAAYNPGETVTLTVDYVSTDFTGSAGSTVTVNATVSDSVNTASLDTATFTINGTGEVVMPTTVTASDSRTPSGTWVLVSNSLSGTTSPFNGTAVLTTTA